MAQVKYIYKMEIDMREIGKIMKEMVMGFSFGIMVMFLKENGEMI